MAFTSVSLTGTVKLSNSTPAAGASVNLTLSTPITDGTVFVAPETISTRCAADGTFTIAVNANDDSTTQPTGTYYSVVIGYGSQTLDSFNVVVLHADSPTVNLFTLATLPNPNVVSPYVSQLTAGTGITLSPTGGTGAVQITSSGVSGVSLAATAAAPIQLPSSTTTGSNAAAWTTPGTPNFVPSTDGNASVTITELPLVATTKGVLTATREAISPLPASATAQSAPYDTQDPTTVGADGIAVFSAMMTADQSGTLVVQSSPDGVTWTTEATVVSTSLGAKQVARFSGIPTQRYVQAVEENGTTAQTANLFVTTLTALEAA